MLNVRQRDWRLIPKITFHLFNCTQSKLGIERRWNGRIILIGLFGCMVQFDFRKNWLEDIVKPHDKPSASVRRANEKGQR